MLDVDLVLVAIGFTGVESGRPALRPARPRARRPRDGARRRDVRDRRRRRLRRRRLRARRRPDRAGDRRRPRGRAQRRPRAAGRERAAEPRRRLACRRGDSRGSPRNPRVRLRELSVLSDAWYMLRRATFDYQGSRRRVDEQQREVYDRGNGATILLRDETRDTVLLTRQFRLPAYLNGHPDGMLIEAPAGLLDGDDAETAIRSEAEEETGYRVAGVTRIGEYFMSPGSVTERIAFFTGSYRAGERVSEGGGARQRGRGHRARRGHARRGHRDDRPRRDRRRQDRAAAPPRTVRIASRDVTRSRDSVRRCGRRLPARGADGVLDAGPQAQPRADRRRPAARQRRADARRRGRPARRQAHPRARRAARRRGLRRRPLPLLGQRLDASRTRRSASRSPPRASR